MGFSSNDEGVKRVRDDFDVMRAEGKGGQLISSDVTGMLLAAYYAILCKSRRCNHFDGAAIAYAYAEADPSYVVDLSLYRQAGRAWHWPNRLGFDHG